MYRTSSLLGKVNADQILVKKKKKKSNLKSSQIWFEVQILPYSWF